jgi:hypothetical protein
MIRILAFSFHLLLGEVENSLRYFNKCVESGTGVCLDRRIVIDSADGIQKAQVLHFFLSFFCDGDVKTYLILYSSIYQLVIIA